MRLDPALEALLMAEGGLQPPDLAALGTAGALAALRRPKPAQTPPPAETARTEDRLIPGPAGNSIRVRLYHPPGAGPFPMLLHFHGGGWVGGAVENDDLRCHALCRRAGAVVASVDYRLAPEHKFPAGLDDAAAALRWAQREAASLLADPDHIGLSGASAGGNLAVAAALRARDEAGRMPRCLVLTYPVCDTALSQPSHHENANAPLLSSAMMAWFVEHYLPAGMDKADSRVAILRAADVSALPPTLVITAACDPLRDEAAELAAKLRAAGVPVRYECHDGMVHGFITRAASLPQAKLAVTQILDFLKTYL